MVSVLAVLAAIWVAVLVPPALGAHARKQAEFEGSLTGRAETARGARARCRRQILGGLLVAMGATLFLGLLPSFHMLLAVHLFLVNSFLGYLTLLVHFARRDKRRTAPPRLEEARRPAASSFDDLRDTDDDLGFIRLDEPERQARWNRLFGEAHLPPAVAS
ncbi:MAG: hypothetical protein ACRD0Q_04745 [Acidimicrobiales bacterium]